MAAACLMGLLTCSLGWTLAKAQPLTGMIHRVWTLAEGAPSRIQSLAQTTDGTLWLGTDAGLFRFDGVSFIQYVGPKGRPFRSNSIAVVASSADGGLWVGFRFGGIAYLKDGQVVNYGPREGLPDGSVWKIVTDRSGTVWAALSNGLFSLQGTRWQETRLDSAQPLTPIGLAVDSAGTLWVNTPNAMLARVAGDDRIRTVATYAHPTFARNSMAIAPDGALWVSTTYDGLLRINAPENSQPVGIRSFKIQLWSVFFDREGNLWLGGADAVHRVPPDSWKAAESAAGGPLTAGEGTELPLPEESQTLEDREGNVWIATIDALHCFRHSNVSVLTLPEPIFTVDGLSADSAGSIWVAAASLVDAGDRLIEVRNGAMLVKHVPAGGFFTSAYRAPDGSLWFGGATGLAHRVDGHFLTTALPQQAQGFPVQALVRDRTGAIWASIVGHGIYRLTDAQWTPYGGLGALPRVPAITETADATGVLWFGYTHNRIARVDGNVVRLYGARDGLDVSNVSALYASPTQLWVGGDFGVERLDGARFVRLHAASGDPFVGITGIVVTTAGELWAYGSAGVVHVPPAEIGRAMHDPTYRVRYETFNRLDGVPGEATIVRPTPSIVEASDGRLWFASLNSLFTIDPRRIRRNPLPPPVKIWTVRAGDQIYSVDSALRLPAGTGDLEVDYTAASLTVPERVDFRYELQGFDTAWHDAADRRQAFYTNLGPGHYIFRVIAANEDGVWNVTGASLPISIQPAFDQTRTFYALCAAAGVAVLWLLYWIRIRQVRSQVRARLEERLIERERIARDLHDTLLQGIQGLILRFQVATDRIPREEPARDLMERALERADQVLEESRSRVKELRVPLGGVGELSKALAETAQPLSVAHSVPFTITVEGDPRPLHPIVREEAYLIASEAITNAFRHARASKIAIYISYDAAALIIRIRDDGQGIESGILTTGGRPEHWGLLGMRERARRTRGHLTIQSARGKGSEVQLRLPAEMAYQQGGRLRGHWWRQSLRRRGGEDFPP